VVSAGDVEKSRNFGQGPFDVSRLGGFIVNSNVALTVPPVSVPLFSLPVLLCQALFLLVVGICSSYSTITRAKITLHHHIVVTITITVTVMSLPITTATSTAAATATTLTYREE
jgi:hypothetical protein